MIYSKLLQAVALDRSLSMYLMLSEMRARD